jgi:hypothetical protein
VLLLAVVVSNGGGRSTAASPSVTCGGRGSRHDYFTLLRFTPYNCFESFSHFDEHALFASPEKRLMLSEQGVELNQE